MEKHITQIREKYVNSPPVTSVTQILTININYFVSHHRIKFPERNSYTFVPRKTLWKFRSMSPSRQLRTYPSSNPCQPKLRCKVALVLALIWEFQYLLQTLIECSKKRQSQARNEKNRITQPYFYTQNWQQTMYTIHFASNGSLLSVFFLSFFLIDLNTGLFLPSSIYGWLILSGSDSLQICSRICVKRIPCIKWQVSKVQKLFPLNTCNIHLSLAVTFMKRSWSPSTEFHGLFILSITCIERSLKVGLLG